MTGVQTCALPILGEKEERNWREECFFQELIRQENETLMNQVRRIDLPQMVNREGKWSSLVEKWNWSQLGEQIRQEAQREKKHGAVV